MVEESPTPAGPVGAPVRRTRVLVGEIVFDHDAAAFWIRSELFRKSSLEGAMRKRFRLWSEIRQ